MKNTKATLVRAAFYAEIGRAFNEKIGINSILTVPLFPNNKDICYSYHFQ